MSTTYTRGKNEYECVECGQQKVLASKAVRKLHPCYHCGDVTTWSKL